MATGSDFFRGSRFLKEYFRRSLYNPTLTLTNPNLNWHNFRCIAGPSPSMDHFGFTYLIFKNIIQSKLHFIVRSDSDLGVFLLKKIILSDIMHTQPSPRQSSSFGRVRLWLG